MSRGAVVEEVAVEAVVEPERDLVPTRRGWRGVIVASRSVDIRSDFGGDITELSAVVGHLVRSGDSLAELDRTLADEDTRIRRAELERAKASVREAMVDRTSARQDRRRVEQLHKDGFASREELEAAELAVARAEANLAGAKAGSGEVRAALQRSTRQRSERTITAPFDGVIARRYVDVGDTVGVGEPVVRLLEASAPTVAFAIELGTPVPGPDTEVEIVSTDGSATWSGTVVSAQPDADPRTGLVAVVARLDCRPSDGCAHATPVIVHPASTRRPQ